MKKKYVGLCIAVLMLLSGLFLVACFGEDDENTEGDQNATAWHIVVEATCTENGRRELRRVSDGYVVSYEIITALGHAFSGWSVVTAPTCTTSGLEEIRCTRCNHVGNTNVLSPTGHNFQYSHTINPTCTVAGSRNYTCANNPSHIMSTPIAALGHAFSGWSIVTAPTCTTSGLEELRCTRCNHVEDTNVLPPTGHDFQYSHTINPTCTTAGSRNYTCANNPSHTMSTPIAALGHVPSDSWSIVTAPTCTTSGLEQLRCTRCNTVIGSNVLPATGHSFGGWEFYESASSDAPERERRVCTEDNNHVEFRFVATLILVDEASPQINSGEGMVTWFMFELEEQTSVRLGFLSTASNVFTATLHGSNANLTQLASFSVHPITFSLSAGKYIIRVASTGGVATGTVHLDDWNRILDEAPVLALGVTSPFVPVNTIGSWFRLELEEATQIQFGILRQTQNGMLSARLHTQNMTSLALTSALHLGMANLVAGTYFIQLTISGSGTLTGAVRVDDLDELLENAPLLTVGIATPSTQVDSIGIWFRVEVSGNTRARISSNTTAGRSVEAMMFAEADLRNSVLFSRAGDGQIAMLLQGTYFVRKFTSPGIITATPDLSTGTVLISDLDILLSAAQDINLGIASTTSSITGEGIWFRLTLTQETPVRFIFTEPLIRTLSVQVFCQNNMARLVRHAHNGGFAHTASLPAGVFYVLLATWENNTVLGSLTIIDMTPILAAAPTLTLGEESPVVTVDSAGMWFRLELSAQTAITITVNNVSGSLIAHTFAGDNLLSSIYAEGRVVTLPAGVYYVLVASLGTSSTGSITVSTV